MKTSWETTLTPKPGFISTPLSSAYWQQAGGGELLLQCCRDCGHLQHYPRSLCIRCWSHDLIWQPATGTGTVWTFTVVTIPGHPAWSSQVPYVLALVELEEGPRLMTNIVGCPPDSVYCGQAVRLRPGREETDNQTLLQFTPSSTKAGRG